MKNDDNLDPHSFVILEALYANKHRPIKQKILFQKILFLTLMNFKKLFNIVDFKPHLLGPYSASIDKTIEQLIKIGNIKKNEKNEFEITDEGIEILEQLSKEIEDKEEVNQILEFEDVVDHIKELFIDFSTDEMLAFIYKSYPDYIESSIKADQLDYEKIFIKLYKKGKLGISKIAELLGLSINNAYNLIKQKTNPIILP